MSLPVSAAGVRKLLREMEAAARREHVLALDGPTELTAHLRRQMVRAGADIAALRLGAHDGADAYLRLLAGEPGEDDVAAFREAHRARVPAVAVIVGPGAEEVPYVLATDVVRVPEGQAFPLGAIAYALAGRLDEDAAPLAARIPFLRGAACERLIAIFARRNALLAAGVWVPAADLPVLALNQLRLVLRLAQAYGLDGGNERMPDLVATLGAGLGFRAFARRLVEILPKAGWAVRPAVAYTATRALGEVARTRFALFPATPRPAGGGRGAP